MFHYKLELATGEPADPPTFATAVPNWREGDRVLITPTVKYRVIETREGVLVVERD